MNPPPPIYFELANTVADYLTKADQLQGWNIDAIEDPVDKKLQAFPFATPSAVGAHLMYNDDKAGIKVRCDVSSDMLSWKDLLPMVSYTKSISGKSFCAEYNFRRHVLSQTYVDPTFFITTRTGITNGLSTVASATTRVFEKVVVGVCASYDPTRSGLKNLTATAVRYGCPNVGGGDLLVKYSLETGAGLHVRVPLHQYMDGAIIAEKNRFIAGVQGRSPCGARCMLSANVNDGTFTATAIRNINDIWKMSITYTSSFSGGSGASKVPRFGLKFSNDSMLE